MRIVARNDNDVYLSYSGHKTYTTCPRQYYHRYVAKTVPDPPENKVNSLFGSTVGLLFEWFYNEKIYLEKGIEDILHRRVSMALGYVVTNEVRKGVVNYEDPTSNYRSVEALKADVEAAVSRGLRTIRAHKLVSHQAEAEVVLDAVVGEHTVGGRADFILRRARPHEDLVIVDGKGSRWRGKYVDAAQLRWYAMLYHRRHKVYPDKLGFLYWRSEPEDAMDWVTSDPGELDAYWGEVLERIEALSAKVSQVQEAVGTPRHREVVLDSFPAYTDRGTCRLCSYTSVCAEGRALLSPDTPDPHGGGLGVVEF